MSDNYERKQRPAPQNRTTRVYIKLLTQAPQIKFAPQKPAAINHIVVGPYHRSPIDLSCCLGRQSEIANSQLLRLRNPITKQQQQQ